MNPIKTVHYNVYFDEGFADLKHFVKQTRQQYSSVFILVDEHTKKLCLPILSSYLKETTSFYIIEIFSGESHKNINTCMSIWETLSEKSADRNSLLINLGGGVLCDIGGFAASTYQRGIDFINIPTTLLSMVDASIGGKTGVNLGVNKNYIGCFSNPKAVFIHKNFLNTLPHEEIKSGYGEIIKHALLSTEIFLNHLIKKGFENVDYLICESIGTKNKYVESDPHEKNTRKSLNLGHTIGHAIEMLSNIRQANSLKHGHAVAIGLVCMAVISEKKKELNRDLFIEICNLIKTNFDYFPIDKGLYQEIFELIQHDKKNFSGNIRMVLLGNIGSTLIDCEVAKEDIFAALNFYNDLYNKQHE